MPHTFDRRDFLKTASAATLAALAAGRTARRVRPADHSPLVHPKPTADTLILLWMAGGMAAPETFDPKRYAPFEVGLPVEQVHQHLPGHRHGGRQHQDLARAGEHRAA